MSYNIGECFRITSDMKHIIREAQRYGRNKATIVNHAYIESGEYRRKFDLISDNTKLNRILYHLAKRMLKHRSGTLYEDMYWIDAETLRIVARETTKNLGRKVRYTRKTKKRIREYDGLITIHSHPSSYPPSISDFNSNWANHYGIGIVCCHDGTLYVYSSDERIDPRLCDVSMEKYRKHGFSEKESLYKTFVNLQKNYKIMIKEVVL